MAKYTLQQKHEECIGCGACVSACDKFWKMNSDGKADLISGKKGKSGMVERTMDEKDLKCNKEAADMCPVNIIHIIDEKGKKLI